MLLGRLGALQGRSVGLAAVQLLLLPKDLQGVAQSEFAIAVDARVGSMLGRLRALQGRRVADAQLLPKLLKDIAQCITCTFAVR
jgi:hypothetical protein